MRFLVATTFVVAGIGCGFEHGQLGGPDETGVDAAVGSGSDNPNPTPAPRTCAYPVTGDLRLCLEFNDGVLAPNVRDASTGQLDPTATGLAATMRSITPPDPAVSVTNGATMSIVETTTLDIANAITLEAWVKPAQNKNQAVVLNDQQYLLGLDDNGHVYCSMAATGVWSLQTTRISPGSWHHIACTYDGSKVHAYVDGATRDCQQDNASGINKNGNKGTEIASDFIGDIDGVRIWARDLGPTDELCAHAGQIGCERSCNSYEYPSGGNYWH